MLTALTRGVSPNIGDCQLTFMSRECIDYERAAHQHLAYEELLRDLGLHVVSLPARPEMPDAVFVEDGAVVVDEVAVVARMGAAERRPEVASLTEVLSRYRPLRFLDAPATLEGGDKIRVGRTIYIGVSSRTNLPGVEQLRSALVPYDYEVRQVGVKGCLHLTTGASYLGENTLLVNTDWVDASRFRGFDLIETPAEEPWGANTVVAGGAVLLSASFPRTRELLARRGFDVRTVDISELEKAEAGVSCMSLTFEAGAEGSLLDDMSEAAAGRLLSLSDA
jgi:dimethylargininase